MDALALADAVYIERQHYCTKCGRFLSESRVPQGLRPGLVRSRLYCQRCEKWRWYDVAVGVIKAA